MINVPIVDMRRTRSDVPLRRFLEHRGFDDSIETAVAGLLARVRAEGDPALLELTRTYDGVDLRGRGLRISEREIDRGAASVDPALRKALRKAHANLRSFARMERPVSWTRSRDPGVRVGERFVPYDRVGIYVPGGTAPLISTALMTVTFAATAGVGEIAAVTPPQRGGEVDPALLYAVSLAGCREIYRVSGVAGIGALAFGTRTIRPVQFIAGPGGPWVTSAKRQVYGYVGLDLVAGPSEVLVLADASARPEFVAADLLAQAEHGSGQERCFLVTTSMRLARAVAAELPRQAESCSRVDRIEPVLRRRTALIVVSSMSRAVQICNRLAPEHLEIFARDARRLADRVRAAGAVFIGESTPEPIGDYVAGPSHVLPTGGTAVSFSGLSTRTFMRRISRIEYGESALRRDGPAAVEIATAEGLDAHARSVRMRLERMK
jgi:histidinol dehydrogenase